MFEDVQLDQIQKDLLKTFVEAARTEPDPDEWFLYMDEGGSWISHHGLPGGRIEADWGDVEALRKAGLIGGGPSGFIKLSFKVMRKGFDYYEYLKIQTGQPA